MRKRIFSRREQRGKGLRPSQETFFILGWTWNFLGDREYPFADEEERQFLWEKYRDQVIKKMYEVSDIREPFRNTRSENRLRPTEWWLRDAPEPKKILNGAKEKVRGICNYQPLKETDLEYLMRLNLLTPDDLNYIETEQFKKAEEHDLRYREFWFASQKRSNQGESPLLHRGVLQTRPGHSLGL